MRYDQFNDFCIILGIGQSLTKGSGVCAEKKKIPHVDEKRCKLRHVNNHPIHKEFKLVTKKFKDAMQEMRNQDWTDWLEAASQQDQYIANKYISNKPTDYSNARIPSLCTVTDNNLPSTADNNASKAAALAELFFPPPPTFSHVPSNTDYLPPLKGVHYFSRARIHQVISSLSPYKAPGPNQIPNMVLIKCCNSIIDHLFYNFRAVIELNVYHLCWLKLETLVLCEIGKLLYDVAKAYHPIGLMDTIPKVFSMLCAKHISYLAKKHKLLPQFSGRPGRNTTDAMLLVTYEIKDAWRNGKMAAALFLDIQGAFSNMVKEQLIHNMRMW